MSTRLFKAGEIPTPFAPFLPLASSRAARRDEVQPFNYRDLAHKPVAVLPEPEPAVDVQAEAEEMLQRAVGELAAAEQEAQRIVQEARREAERLINVAQARSAEIEREAYVHGEAQGRASLAGEVAHQVSDLRDRLTESINEIQSLATELITKGEREMVELALEIAKKVVHREVTLDREVALTLARLALTRLPSHAKTVVRLHPEDYRYAAAHSDRLLNEGTVEFCEDKAVALGGCLIQTEMGQIDARIAQQFREIEKGFWENTD